MRRLVVVLALLGLVLAACMSDPTTSEEYQELEEQLADTERMLADVTAELDALVVAAQPDGSEQESSEFSKPADAAISYGIGSAEAFLVGARVSFRITSEGTFTTDSDGSMHTRVGAGRAIFVGNDPRITGEETITWNTDRWGSGVTDGAITQWGNAVIETADGTWEGSFSGVMTSDMTDVITWWLSGTGDYEGQSMFMWTTETNLRGEGINYALVFPGSSPVTVQPSS